MADDLTAEQQLQSDADARAADEAKAKDVQWTDTVVETEQLPASERLRAFEDEHLGTDTPRFHGKVERGSGAPLHQLSDELRREHAALERSESEKGSA